MEFQRLKVITGSLCSVSPNLEDFYIHDTIQSSNVAFIGFNVDQYAVFVQFKNGSKYIYKDVPKEVQDTYYDPSNVLSAGEFVSKKLRGNYQFEKVENYSIAPADLYDVAKQFNQIKSYLETV